MDKVNKKHVLITALITIIVAVSLFAFYNSRKNYAKIIAVTGATPLAFKVDVKPGVSLEVSGGTEKVYKFNSSALNSFASTYLRTKEVDAEGKFQGTYRYTGIPVINILEGVAPKKPEGAPFDRPLDMLVTFISSDGKQSHFSYGEITMTDDANPVMLAYSRNELLPHKEKKDKPYTLNIHKGDVKGLRLICPAEADTARYLDDVVKIVLREIDVDNSILPAMRKGADCKEDIKDVDFIRIVDKGRVSALSLSGVDRASVKNRVRTGHGQGYKGISGAQGYDLISLLKKNFPGAGKDDYFLFVACDGYRALFSGREIFLTEAGKNMMLISAVDYEKKHSAGLTLGPIKDYYVDRETWAVSHIVRVNSVGDVK